MRRLKSREIESNLAQIRQEAVRLFDQTWELVHRANSDVYEGFGNGGDGRSSDHSDPTARAGCQLQRDDVLLAALDFKRAVLQCAAEMRSARMAADRIMAISAFEAARLERQSAADSSGACANPACGIVVMNTPNDRIKEGRCRPCYEYRKHHHGNERPRVLCHPVDVTDATNTMLA